MRVKLLFALLSVCYSMKQRTEALDEQTDESPGNQNPTTEEEREPFCRKNLAQRLGLDSSSPITKDTVRNAYHKLILRYHPDKNVGKEEEAKWWSQEIISAYKILKKSLENGKGGELFAPCVGFPYSEEYAETLASEANELIKRLQTKSVADILHEMFYESGTVSTIPEAELKVKVLIPHLQRVRAIYHQLDSHGRTFFAIAEALGKQAVKDVEGLSGELERLVRFESSNPLPSESQFEALKQLWVELAEYCESVVRLQNAQKAFENNYNSMRHPSTQRLIGRFNELVQESSRRLDELNSSISRLATPDLQASYPVIFDVVGSIGGSADTARSDLYDRAQQLSVNYGQTNLPEPDISNITFKMKSDLVTVILIVLIAILCWIAVLGSIYIIYRRNKAPLPSYEETLQKY